MNCNCEACRTIELNDRRWWLFFYLNCVLCGCLATVIWWAVR